MAKLMVPRKADQMLSQMAVRRVHLMEQEKASLMESHLDSETHWGSERAQKMVPGRADQML